MKYSYVTTLLNDRFYPGLCALSYSLKKVNTQYPLTVVVPVDMPEHTKQRIADLGLPIIEATGITVDDDLLAANPEKRWNLTLFKLNIFKLTQFDKIVFLDLDMIVMGNLDHLFEYPHLSAVAAGQCKVKSWTALNSGILVIAPNVSDYEGLVGCCSEVCRVRLEKGLGFGDQDVINYYYPDWEKQAHLHLSEAYNCIPICIDILRKKHGFDYIKVIHFCEPIKPWQFGWKDFVPYLARSIKHKQWSRIRALLIYRKYVKKSCPNFKKFH